MRSYATLRRSILRDMEKLIAAIVRAGSLQAALPVLRSTLDANTMAVVEAIADAESQVMAARSSSVNKSKLTANAATMIEAGLRDGLPYAEIARKAGVARQTVSRRAKSFNG